MNDIGAELHRRDHARDNQFMWGRDYGKNILTDMNMLAHSKGTDCLTRDALQRAHKEIERLRKIEAAAKDLIRAVDKTADHTEWFKPIGALAMAIGRISSQQNKAVTGETK